MPVIRDRDLPLGFSSANNSSKSGVWALVALEALGASGALDLLRTRVGFTVGVGGGLISSGTSAACCFANFPTDSDALRFGGAGGVGVRLGGGGGVGVFGADLALTATGGGAGINLDGSGASSIFDIADFAFARGFNATACDLINGFFFTPFVKVSPFMPAGGAGGCGGGAPGSIAIPSFGFRDLPRRGLGVSPLIFALTPIVFGALPPFIIIGVGPGGGPGGGCPSFDISIGCPLLLERGFRPACPNSVKRETYDWSAVAECGPRWFAICSAIAIFFSNFAWPCSANIFCVPSWASCISSLIVKSNCSGFDAGAAAAAAMILAPFEPGGGGPPLDDDTDKTGVFGGMRPCPPLTFIRRRGIPPEPGSSGGD